MAELVGIGAAARALGLHENTLRNWSSTGKIPFQLSPGGQRRFNLEDLRAALGRNSISQWSQEFSLAGLDEARVWHEITKKLSISGNEPAVDIAHYAFTEMLNNAIDHSEGDAVHISFEKKEDLWKFVVVDDGIGVFSRIQNEFNLSAPLEAIGELTKGKRTSAPDAHTGEGIFFTSKMVAKFTLESQTIKWVCDNNIGDFAVLESDVDLGTRVTCEILTAARHRSIDIFQAFTENHQFNKSRPIVKLFEIGKDFVSRSEAKRLVAGLEKFSDVDLDFSRVEGVGQGFADQVFRVWQNVNSETKLHVINASPNVKFMINRARGGNHE